jgi:hypothetical protein
MCALDYTAGKALEQLEALDLVPLDPRPSLVVTLADDNVGVMPQLATGSVCRLVDEVARRGWYGFSTRCWLIGDLDPAAAAVSRVAWDEAATAEAITHEQVTRVCGEPAAGYLLAAFGLLEDVTRRLDAHGIGFGFPVEGLMLKHWDGQPLGEPFRRDRADYARALDLARAALAVARPAGRGYVAYHAGRLAFAVGYLDCVELVQRASVAHRGGDPANAAELVREGLGCLRRPLEAWAGVARDLSDRGAIASINEFG